MRTLNKLGVLALTALAAGACTDVTNPIEETGTLADPFVRFESSSAVGVVGTTATITIELPTRVEEDVTVQYSFGGTAVFGEDYIIVDNDGNPRSDVTAAGGTASIPFDFEDTNTPSDSIKVFVPLTTTDQSVLEVTLQSASTTSGRTIETGYIPDYQTTRVSFEGFVSSGVATGAYSGTAGGIIAGGVSVSVSQPASPVVIDGEEYTYVLSDFAQGLFTIAIPWGFNVTSGGTVIFSPADAGNIGVTADLTDGQYDFTTNTLSFDAVLTCCGGEGFSWSYSIAGGS